MRGLTRILKVNQKPKLASMRGERDEEDSLRSDDERETVVTWSD